MAIKSKMNNYLNVELFQMILRMKLLITRNRYDNAYGINILSMFLCIIILAFFLGGDAELKCQLSGADKYVFALVSQIRHCKLIMTSVFV